MEDLEQFYIMSGLIANNAKTHIVWIGSKKYSEDKICSENNFEWTTNCNF